MGPGIHVGTSGWHYRHWAGPFYPARTRSEDFLSCYTQHFRTVEINNTFYQLPSRETLASWRDKTPKEFRFACKASRFITHMKKLKEPARSTKRFFDTIEVLDDKLGPILFQLPPRWRLNLERLRSFLAVLPKGYRYAFEFRDESWFTKETLSVLADHHAAFCIYELAGRRSPEAVTADLVYIRLHGPGGAYRGRYDSRTLGTWASKCRSWCSEGRMVYCYFDNDEKGYAPEDAMAFAGMV